MVAAPYTVPVPGFDWLARARTRHLTRLARSLLTPADLPGWLTGALAGVRPLFADLLRDEPATLLGALALPVVAAPLGAGRLDLAVPQLLLELGRRRKIGREGAWWSAPIPLLASPPAGKGARFDPPLVGALFVDGGVEVAAGVGWEEAARPMFHPLADGGWLGTLDTNPLWDLEAHPDKHGNAVSLGGESVETWVRSVDTARALVRGTMPELAAEHAGVLGMVVPVGVEPERSLSASYREAIGQIYLSLHPQTIVMAEAIVHETQHNKLNLLAWLDPVLENGDERYPSPVRPDPRPMWGLLLAVHAFLPVEAMHRAWIAASAPWASPRRLAQVRALNHDGMAVLRAYARPTPLGRELIEGLERLEAEMAGQ